MPRLALADLEPQFFPEFDPSTPPIERHTQGAGLHEAFVNERLYLRSLNPGFGNGAAKATASFLARCAMLSANLWKAIDDQWGHTDGMVPGKDHQARLYAFSFLDRTLLCTTETGEQGSRWFLVERVLGPRETSMAGTIPIPEDEPSLRDYWHPFVTAFTHQVKHHPSIQSRWQRAIDAVVQRQASVPVTARRVQIP